MPEWLNGPVSKTGVGATPPRVRIPLSPPPGFFLKCGQYFNRPNDPAISGAVFSSFHRLPAIGRLGAAFKEAIIRYRPRQQRRNYIHRYSFGSGHYIFG